MALLGLIAFAGRDCRRLSGGETQRVILAGALAMRPGLLTLDEPMTDLDAGTRERLAGHLHALSSQMAVVVLDIGYFDWMKDLISSYRILSAGTLGAPTGEELMTVPLPPEILLPDGTERVRRLPVAGHRQGTAGSAP